MTITACGGANPAAETSNKPVDVGVAVPSAWTAQGQIRVGIACDYPPFGYTDLTGGNAGYDAEVARTLAAYAFGNDSKVSFTCVTPQNRIPYLSTNKIDLIISTLGYTQERAKTIDYSTAYFTSGAKLLVANGSNLDGWQSLHGKTIITKTGTTSSTFLTNCYADSQQLRLDSTSDAVAALKAGRGVAFAEDSTLLLGLALNDKSLKVVGQDEAQTPWGLGIRQGDTETKKWVDAALADMQMKDTFWTIFNKAVQNKEAAATFAGNMPRPGASIAYTDENTLADCSK
ncbi:transporter substrate-binding domain-containing protein [Nocardia sp. R6R-6]|uniref:transporter substrate-binding domain-containing protein n=1 Tax=Nocardia sp. R6R-6 TaxID=3459303 RepID=UPI00403D5836